jgi:hypothetical protein
MVVATDGIAGKVKGADFIGLKGYEGDFSRLDTLLGGMQVTSDFLAQQLQLLPNISNDK